MIATRKARFVLWFIAIGLVAAALVDLCGLEGSEEPRTGDEVRAVSPSPTPVSVPVTLSELVRGSVATEAVVRGNRTTEVEEDAGDTTARSNAPSTTPHLLTVEPSVLTEDDLLALLASSPWPRHEWSNVVSVAHCESRFQPEAVGDNGRAVGLLQIRTDVHGRLVRTFDLTDPWANLVAGYVIYLEAGRSWWPWSCA